MATHVGRIILTLDGVALGQTSKVSTKNDTGRKEVKGLTPTGLPAGYTDGTPSYEITGTFYRTKLGLEVDWRLVEGAVITITPRDGLGPKTAYFGVYVKDYNEDYDEENPATIQVTFGALDRRKL